MKTEIILQNHIGEIEDGLSNLLAIEKPFHDAVETIVYTLDHGGKVVLCGNGGSAADAQHIAGELIGRFSRERSALPAVALTGDTVSLTAIANDYGYDTVFERQVRGILFKEDVLIGISTSGNSENVRRAFDYAWQQKIPTIGLLGRDGGKIAEYAKITLLAPGTSTAAIQTMHRIIYHALCDAVEERFSPYMKK